MSRTSAQKIKVTNDRITVDALKFYVPLFHAGDKATERLLEDENILASERNTLEIQSRLKKLATDKIASLSGPLMTREINKLIKGSHLNGREDMFDLLYYAGITGLVKGLRHFDVDKLNKSSTNYLFQWIVTYAKKELNIIEAPFGIAPSRFQKYKKISAVRKKLSDELGRYAENDEVLVFFHSGRADVKNMNGRVEKSDKPYASNQSITLELVAEQEHFEKNLSYVSLIDPLEDYAGEVRLSEDDSAPFTETLFGVFLYSYNFTPVARAVFMSDLGTSNIPMELEELVVSLTAVEYRRVSNLFKEVLRDVDGPFYSFLVDNLDNFEDFDITGTMEQIKSYDKAVNSSKYLILFDEKKVKKL